MKATKLFLLLLMIIQPNIRATTAQSVNGAVKFKDRRGVELSARVDTSTGGVSGIFGITDNVKDYGYSLVGIDDATLDRLARLVLMQYSAVLNFNVEDVRFEGTLGGRSQRQARYTQLFHGVPIEWSFISVNVNAKSGRVESITGKMYPGVECATKPLLSSSEAAIFAQGNPGEHDSAKIDKAPELVVLPQSPGRSFALCWKVMVETFGPYDYEAVFISAQDGTILFRYRAFVEFGNGEHRRSSNLLKSSSADSSKGDSAKESIEPDPVEDPLYGTLHGHVSGSYWLRKGSDSPVFTYLATTQILGECWDCDGEEPIIEPVNADYNGYWVIDHWHDGDDPPSPPYPLPDGNYTGEIPLMNDFVWTHEVDDEFDIDIESGVSDDHNTDWGLIEHVNVLVHATNHHGYFTTDSLNQSSMDFAMEAWCTTLDSINGGANGHRIIFGRKISCPGGPAVEWAKFRDVVYHEYSHNAVFHLYGHSFIGWPPNQTYEAATMDEAFADYFAASHNDDMMIGDGALCSSNPDKRRRLQNTLTLTSDFTGNDKNHDSQILSGSVWDLRTAALQTVADNLAHDALARQPQAHTWKCYQENIFDSDTELYDQAHHAQISTAFNNHEIGSNIPLVTKGWNTLSVPRTVCDPQRAIVWPEATSVSFFNAQTQAYVNVPGDTNLTNGVGYWANMANMGNHPSGPRTEKLISFCGSPLSDWTTPVFNGWNLVGSIEVALDTEDPYQVSSNYQFDSEFFAYDPVLGYHVVTSLVPGIGHWVKTLGTGSGTLRLRKPSQMSPQEDLDLDPDGPPEVITLRYPEDNAACSSNVVRLEWAKSATALNYQVQVAAGSGFQNAVFDDIGINDTLREVSSLEPGQEYWWRVRGKNRRGLGPWSTFRTFTTGYGTPVPADTTSPVTAYEMLDNVTLLDSDGRMQRLFLHNESRPLIARMARSDEMPPRIPGYSFDARFESGRFIEKLPKNRDRLVAPIRVINAQFPLEVYWSTKRGNQLGCWLILPSRDTFALQGANQITLDSTINGRIAILITRQPHRGNIELQKIGSRDASLPDEFALHPSYPNPFNPATTLRYDLPTDVHVALKVFDITGREVASLVDGDVNAGYHVIVFDGTDLPSGVYFYRLQAGDFVQTRKMLLVK